MVNASLRIRKISNRAELRQASWHSPLQNERTTRKSTASIEDPAWSKGGSAGDLQAALDAHKAEFGAYERRNAPLALRIFCRVSPEWVEDATTPQDTALPRALIERATAWAESWGGTSSVIAARLHPGKASMVELVVSPVRESRGKPVISTHKALRDLKERMGNRNEYAALQASWADWCAAHLAPALTRGIRSSPAPASDRLSGQTAPAALGQPVEALWTALTTSYLSPESVETLNGFLMLKAEILRHKAEGADYIPPKGVLSLENLAAFGRATGPDPWPYIEAIRSAAYQVTEVACGFGMGLDDSANDRYEAGHAWFPDRADRIHLAAVVAKCGAYCAQVEAEVKNVVFASDRKIDPCTRWPQGATQEILRHETNLGLLAQEAG